MTLETAIEILQRRNNHYAQRKGITDYVRENEQIINAIIDFANARQNQITAATERDAFPFAAAEFSGFDAPITNIFPCRTMRVSDAYELITHHAELKQCTDYLRENLTQSKEIKAKYFPYCCFSGVFTERNAQKLEQQS
ncbi:MAG: hypothetical protein LBB41_00280 [Prevotellaceae bacterium]|jgi:hypothetical protein|nr:hypothetical protein [Prevotellaceae bacterium]